MDENSSSGVDEQSPPNRAKNQELMNEAKNFFEFHKKEIGDSFRKGRSVLYLDFLKITEFSNKLAEEILMNPEEAQRIVEVAMEEMGLVSNVRVRFTNLPKSQEIKVREIRSKNLNEMVVVEGIVRQASDVRPQVVNAKFECPSCGTLMSVLQMEKKFREPSRCSCGRRGGFKLISKEMVDTQRLVIEEAPESLSGGEQPKRINVFLKEDLVEPRMEEKTTPGSRVKIIGVLKEVPVPLHTGGVSTRFELAIEVNNIIPMEETFEELDINEEDERQILELAQDPHIFDKLTTSLVPSVWGYTEIKQALVLQLFGGVKKTHADGQKSRGDLHILLIGDPGVAKSATLVFMAGISPKGRYVVGKSASGAGLTATVVRDEYLRGWSLEAGAMVLSHKGLVCIDELEKMDPNDRSAMHEAMEQQSVTISKANVQACYSDDTEVLTEEGWKKYNDVGKLKIAQYDTLRNTIEFRFHNGLYVYDYTGKMHYFNNKRNDILVTPNHMMLVKREKQKRFEKIIAEEITSNRIKLINSGEYLGNEEKSFILPAIKHKQNRVHQKYIHQHKDKKIPMDLWLEFLGYYVTEGGIETAPTIGIVQKKGVKAEKIKKCMKKLTGLLGCSLSEIDIGEYIRFKITQTQLYEFLKNYGKKCYFKHLGINFSLLSKKQLKILYDAMMLGDGSSDGKYLSCTSKELSDEFQAVAHLIGKSASQNIHYLEGTRGKRKTMHRVSLSNGTELFLKRSSIKKIDYSGKVFCFSTETGFFVTRRNGKIAIQGNTLRCETSVLAAANPKFGRFDPYQPISQQIDLPPTLINRFDVIFPLRDLPDRKKDELIASHVLLTHQSAGEDMLIPRDLFRKYIAYAKQRVIPRLSDDAIEEIKKFYVELRNMPISSEGSIRPIPISARQLQALIRMSEASAKMKLSEEVTLEDATRAINLMKYYLMQVGYDYESKTFDIDRGTGGMPASQRNKVFVVRDLITNLENKLGKMIPVEEIEKELEGKMSREEIDEAITKLSINGVLFKPKKGYVSRT